MFFSVQNLPCSFENTFCRLNSGDDKKRYGYHKHKYAYQLSYGEEIEEQGVVPAE